MTGPRLRTMQIDEIDPGQMAKGYRDGFNKRPQDPKGSPSYDHGYQNGAADREAIDRDEG